MDTNRRDLLKALVSVPATAAAAAAQTPAAQQPAAHEHPAHKAPAPAQKAAAYKPKTFDAHEWKTVHVLSDLIIPADSRSGSATQAGVPEFIDGMITERGDRLQSQIRGGLAWLDHESTITFGKDFISCSATQQKQILDKIAYPARVTPETSQATAFFSQFRELVASGFYTSKIGMADLQFMGNQALDEWQGCPASATKKLGIDT